MKYIIRAILIIGLGSYCLWTPSINHREENPESSQTMDRKNLYGSADGYYTLKAERRKNGYFKNMAPSIYAEMERARRTPIDATSPAYPLNHQLQEIAKARKSKPLKNNDLNFKERGPGNVAGRTRALLVLPQDSQKKTWIAASASGGIWKTTDGGSSWINKTPELPNLGTNTLAMSAANPDVIYAGTGEHFVRDVDGAGMFKSIDGGESWFQIANPELMPDFKNVSRIVINPDDENHIIATTRNSVWADHLSAAIYRTLDGGQSWERLLSSDKDRYDDIIANPLNFNSLYVAINNTGILKSTDGGISWLFNNNIKANGRIEIDISPVDTSRLYASVQGSESDTDSDLWVSFSAGRNWRLAVENIQSAIGFLGGQGWYDNVCKAHPFDPDVVYVGGVNLFKVNILNSEITKVAFEHEDNGTSSFIDYVNGLSIGGGIIRNNSLPEEDFVSVEIRFGQGPQLAHRFSVSGQGSGVPASGYLYRDYVEVPFQVWDITNNQQLMVSFRDQQDDGQWNLIERRFTSNTATDSREYIFIHTIPYSTEVNEEIARTGGNEHQQMYLVWPALAAGAIFDPSLNASLSLLKRSRTGQGMNTTVVSDAYRQFNSVNTFTGAQFSNNKGLHPDQHSLQFIIDNPREKSFRLLLTNDGGVYISRPSTDPGITNNAFDYAGFGFNTTQFYSADKAPEEDRYIGGMQDNSTWFTKAGATADASSFYQFAFGGDGFEVLWNNRDPDLIIGSIQFNNLQRSSDGGLTWQSARGEINDSAPFVSRLSNHRSIPDRIFAVGSSGVWRSENFGLNWQVARINSVLWGFNNRIDVEVSHANPDIIWSGGRLDSTSRLFYSLDAGVSFQATDYYPERMMGMVSGIGTHPDQDSTVYALFSFFGRPKVLRSSDLGNTWEDISGFGTDTISNNGFPNVATNCLLVFPNDTDRIWVGTEIGIVESKDNGVSWSLLNANLPNVSVHDMKIQDDQIVIATYGRGIWSVTIPEVQREYVFPPTLLAGGLSPMGVIAVKSRFNFIFDSVSINIDPALNALLGSNLRGEQTYTFPPSSYEESEYPVTISGFRKGQEYESMPSSIYLFDVPSPVEEYTNDFRDSAMLDDFFGRGFSIRLEEGFEKLSIHSEHNYPDRTEIFYQLKQPVLITTHQTLSYKDVVIVETGEEETTFNDRDFYDYVVVEGTSDGINWRPLAPGYDSSLDPGWNKAYEDGESGRADLYRDQEINLNEVFKEGDIIFIRFRLFADPFVNGWGWSIDDIRIELDRSTSTSDVAKLNFVIYPNPTSDQLFIQLPSAMTGKISVYDLNGRIVKQAIIDRHSDISIINVAELNSGVYLIHVEGGKTAYSAKFIRM